MFRFQTSSALVPQKHKGCLCTVNGQLGVLLVAETPTWRRAGGQFPLCNACGVYRTTHGTNRIPPTSVPLQAVTRPKLALPTDQELDPLDSTNLG